MVRLFSVLKNNKIAVVKLDSISTRISDAPHERPNFSEFEEVPCVMIEHLKEDGILSENPRFITKSYHEKLKSTQLKDNDLLMSRIGVTTGVTSLVNEKFIGANISGNITLIRLKDEYIGLSRYVLNYLNSDFFQKYIKRILSNSARDFLTVSKIKNLPVVLLNERIRNEITDKIEGAFAEKKAKETEAREKLASVDALILDALGITLPKREANTLDKRIFFTKSSDISSGRFDPDALHPERINAIKAIQSSKYPIDYLHSVAKFIRIPTTENISNSRYVGLENIQSKTGIFIPKAEVEEFGTANIFKKGQILFSKLRPYLNKVFHAGFDGVCSTEFYVLDGFRISNNYLACFLRTSLIVSQTKRLMTGNTLPRLQTKDVESLQIPVPPPEVQAEIAGRVEKIYAEAKLLREQGAEILKQAKAEVEQMILGA
ncbi:MAG TPA: restriction endonuclease subunit S [Pyrinomonadaceae bacterium]